MKAKTLVFLVALLGGIMAIAAFTFSDREPWSEEQLMKPADLSLVLKSTFGEKPLIFNIGPAGSIQGSIHIGATQEHGNLQALEKQVQAIPKDKAIVIYCGCCPFKDCPNIRPAFSKLTQLGFTNHKLLALPQNLKVDWIDKGYPMAQ